MIDNVHFVAHVENEQKVVLVNMSHEHTHIHTITTNHSPHYQPLETWNGKEKFFETTGTK